MNTALECALKGIQLGAAQSYRNLTIFPILGNGAAGPEYIAMAAALEQGFLKIEEISEGGSVPEAVVTNAAAKPVLLLDGEELVGAKQNRVLNTTILLKPQCKTVINVSCTERGRWSYASREFRDSDVMMARRVRARKNESVAASLVTHREFRANQGAIWDGIEELACMADVCSPTAAMRDVFREKEQDLQPCLDAFYPVDSQRGLVFLIDAAVVGMDFVSRPDVYTRLHGKLVRSYVVDAMPRDTGTAGVPSDQPVRLFIERILTCAESAYPSIGLGTDLRLERPDACGSVLLYEETCIHAAFFARTPEHQDRSEMRGFRQRRASRERHPRA